MVLSTRVLGWIPQPSSNSPPFPFPLSWEALVDVPITVGRGGREVTAYGVHGHSGWSKGYQSASKPGRFLCSSPAVCHSSVTRSQWPTQEVKTATSIPACIYLHCLKLCDPSGPQRLSDHIAEMPAAFGLGDPDWPVEGRFLLIFFRAGAAQAPLPPAALGT